MLFYNKLFHSSIVYFYSKNERGAVMRILLLPFNFVWWLIGFLFSLTGRLLGIIVGSLLMAAGIGLIFTFFGAIIGIPLGILGLLLVIKSIFG